MTLILMKIIRNKTENMSVSLPKELKEEIVNYARSQEQTVSQFIKEASRSYILRRELERLQNILGPALRKMGIKSYDDAERYFG